MPKRYKLIKDIPGNRGNTIVAGATFSKTDFDRYTQDGDLGFTIDADVVEKNATWFESVQERSYPFEPSMGEDYFRADATEEDPFDRVMGESWDSVGMEIHWREISNLWRTEADARRRVDLEPLFNRALQAVINRGPAAAVSTEGSFGIGRDASGGWRVTEHDQFIGYKVASGTIFSSREDAEVVVAFLKALFA